jgi:uncharacterized protein (DUF1684 family)
MHDPLSSPTNEPQSIASASPASPAPEDDVTAPTAPAAGARPVRPDHPARDPVAVELGRRGGLKGGKARAAQLSPEQRHAIALKAAQARWGTKVPVAPDAHASDSPDASEAPDASPAPDPGLAPGPTALAVPVPSGQPETSVDEATLAPQLAVLPLTVRGASAAADWPAADLASARVAETITSRPGTGAPIAGPVATASGQAASAPILAPTGAVGQPAAGSASAGQPGGDSGAGYPAFQAPQASAALGAPASFGLAQASMTPDRQAGGVPQASSAARQPAVPSPIADYERLDGLPGLDSPSQLRLTDWRRRVAELYSDVRRLSLTDPEAGWALWCTAREALYRRHPLSPVPADSRGAFNARHFPYNRDLRFELPVRPDGQARAQAVGADSHAVALPNSGPEPMTFERVGRVDVPIGGSTYRLSIFWIPGYAGGLFLPFRDGTNGSETYGAGRYLLDTAKGADLGPGLGAPGTIVVDFNFAFQPSCAFDPRWACPLAPPENRLDIPIRAGERLS